MRLSPGDAEFILLLAGPDTVAVRSAMSTMTGDRLDRIGAILQEYHRENTTNSGTEWTRILEEAGINGDEGKAAIAHARRLGVGF